MNRLPLPGSYPAVLNVCMWRKLACPLSGWQRPNREPIQVKGGSPGTHQSRSCAEHLSHRAFKDVDDKARLNISGAVRLTTWLTPNAVPCRRADLCLYGGSGCPKRWPRLNTAAVPNELGKAPDALDHCPTTGSAALVEGGRRTQLGARPAAPR